MSELIIPECAAADKHEEDLELIEVPGSVELVDLPGSVVAEVPATADSESVSFFFCQGAGIWS